MSETAPVLSTQKQTLDIWPAPAAGKRVALFLDYDGTLAPIQPRPELAVLPPEGHAVLKQLFAQARQQQVYVALVSGRSVEQLRGFLGDLLPAEVLLCGLHGGEIWHAGSETWLREAKTPALAEALDLLSKTLPQCLADDPELRTLLEQNQLVLEDKRLSLAVHFRLVADRAQHPHIVHTVEQCVQQAPLLATLLKCQGGKAVVEVVPKTFSKANAVNFAIDHWCEQWSVEKASLFPVYFGDDLTDEYGFEATNALGGTSVRVGEESERPSKAQHFIPDVDAVYTILSKLT